jgi:hypothetical protein
MIRKYTPGRLAILSFALLGGLVSSSASALVLNATRSAGGEVAYWNLNGTANYDHRVYAGSYGIALNTTNTNPGEIQTGYEYDLNPLLGTPVTVNSATFSILRGQEFSGCLSLDPCPLTDGLKVYSYAGDGALTGTDFDLGTQLATEQPLPAEGTIMTFDVTGFIDGLVAGSSRYAGFNVRATSDGGVSLYSGTNAAGERIFHVARLDIDYTEGGSTPGPQVPEPGVLGLLGLGLASIGLARKRRAS